MGETYEGRSASAVPAGSGQTLSAAPWITPFSIQTMSMQNCMPRIQKVRGDGAAWDSEDDGPGAPPIMPNTNVTARKSVVIPCLPCLHAHSVRRGLRAA